MSDIIYSIGHGNKELKQLVKELADLPVDILVDVRSRPGSKFHPQFNRAFMLPIVEENGIKYMYRGKNLGGLDENVYREEVLDEMTKLVKSGKKVALMCSETSPAKCHRFRAGEPGIALEPEFAKRGLTMEHLGMYRSKVNIPQLGLF